MKFDHIPFAVLGVSHKTAPVDVREKVALSEEEQKHVLRHLLAHEHTNGAMVLSTCNRTEIYISSEHIELSITEFQNWFQSHKASAYFAGEYAYLYTGYDALLHYFKVISSLEAQIVGETQITGQVKTAYELAFEMQATDSLINKVFNFGMQAQKKVRTDTNLCQGAVSISFASVELAEKIFTNLSENAVLLIGAGETAELAADHFRKKGVSTFHVANRTFQNAQILAEKFNGRAFAMDQLEAAFENMDIVITATASQDFLLKPELIKKIMKTRRQNPLFLIDLAIPRNIDPAVNDLADVYLYNLDDLKEIVLLNTGKRQNEIPKALKAVETIIKDFDEWFVAYSLSSTIDKLKAFFGKIFHHEIDRVAKTMPAGVQPALDELEKNLTNKLVSQYIRLLKKHNAASNQHLELIHQLFELDRK